MQFLVIGRDGTDENAHARRMAARQAHIALGDQLENSGNRWYGAVLLDGNNTMIGSMAVMDFPSENALHEWLKNEPYVTGNVWKSIEVIKCDVKNPWKFNRPQSFFLEKKKRK